MTKFSNKILNNTQEAIGLTCEKKNKYNGVLFDLFGLVSE